MKLTNEQIKAAAETDIVAYCTAAGIPVVRFSGDTYMHAEYDSLKITGFLWVRHSGKTNRPGGHTGGNAIQFVEEYEEVSFQVAVLRLLEASKSPLMPDIKPSVKEKLIRYSTPARVQGEAARQIHARPAALIVKEKSAVKEKKPFALPPRHSDNKRVIAYLTRTRGIDFEIVNHMIKHDNLYEEGEHDDCVYHNAVFVGYDIDNVARYAALHGTCTPKDRPVYKGEVEGSKKRFGWCFMPDANSLLLRVYESPIDAMSHMTMDKLAGGSWRAAHRLSLGALAYDALGEYIKNHPEIKNISFCLDNDIAGRQKTEEFSAKLEKQGYTCTTWHKADSMALCSYKDRDGLLRFLAVNPQIKTISFQTPGADQRTLANETWQTLTGKGYTCVRDNADPKMAKDFNEALQLKKINE